MGTSVQNFFTSRDNNVDPDTYVGQLDRLWYNPDTNQIFISDGVTPGGRPVDLGANANAIINNLTVNSIGTGDSSAIDFRTDARFTQGATIDVGLDVFGTLAIDGNLTVTGNIPAATTVKIGGVRAGPGANISNTGLLTIDTTGLPLSFGNFTANNNILTIVNSDEDMVLATQGSAEIQLVGNIGFYKTNGLPPAPENLFFRAQDDGQIQILVPNTDPFLGAVEIIGTTTGLSVSPAVEGVMLHVTGQPDTSTGIYNDGVANTAAYVSRRYNGTAASPSQVLSGQGIMVIAAQGYGATGFGARGTGGITFTALEDFTDTAQGMQINFQTAAIGSNSRATVATINSANGVTATRFVTAGTVEATGNVTGGNLNTVGAVVATGNISGGNVTVTNITLTGNIGNVNALQFDTSATVTANTEGLVYWNSTDRTVNINQQNGVSQQVGQEQYILALNETGSTIDNGTFVGFAGAGDNGTARIKIAPFLANGAQPSLYAVGIATESIANTATGFVTTFGVVRDIDTTGNAVSQTWGVGNILYANPDVSGALTNVKPTAPDNVIPVAAVLKVDATEGEIFVRPTIEQKMNYGVFTRLSDLTLGSPNVGNAVALTNSETSNGVTLGSPASRLVVDQSGLYQIAVTAQFDTTGGTFDEDAFYIWLRKNGSDVDNSMRRGGIDGEIPDGVTVSSTRTLSLDANDYIEVVIAVSNTRVFLQYDGATAFGPATAALEVSVTQVQL